MCYFFVDGYGNFGLVDGDLFAVMCYIEVCMSRIVFEMFCDIEKEIVDFMLNFDELVKELKVLLLRFFNFLVNGSQGIVVGMVINILFYNLVEVIDVIVYLFDNENVIFDDIMKIIKGFDFLIGGYIIGKKGIKDVYVIGKGKIIVWVKMIIE